MKADDSSKNVSGFRTDYQFITNSKMRTIPKMDKEEKNTIVCNSNENRCSPANTRVTAILFSLNCQRLDIFFSIIQIFVFSVFPVFKLHVLSTGNILVNQSFSSCHYSRMPRCSCSKKQTHPFLRPRTFFRIDRQHKH